jgi:hypothetical protein
MPGTVMNFEDEITELRRHLDSLASAAEESPLDRYVMLRPNRPPGLYWQLRWMAGRAQRWLQARGILDRNPWPVSLDHSGISRDAKPLLIWAVGTDRDTVRESCLVISGLMDQIPGLAPVLVTDVADFAFYSRLGWLVEYLPPVDGDGEAYESRKAKYLARLYYGAPAIPATAGLAPGTALQEIRKRIAPEPNANS